MPWLKANIHLLASQVNVTWASRRSGVVFTFLFRVDQAGTWTPDMET